MLERAQTPIPKRFVLILVTAGSDVVSMKCKADKVDGGFLINGNKMWCTNGPSAQTLVLLYF